ncbi:MAG TPA: cytochrome C oxidase subunit IV family protein [Bryobacteraceae bacterium]|jgi:cytochrome c oxidase subunit IV|nr:cytochrome C oxidase subunit IV family protein [Bryobacteraceae bacterium]
MPSTSTYYKIFALLMILAFATTGIAFIDLGIFNPIVAMLIAVTKATLVVLFFMHVRYQGRLTFVFAIAGFCWLLILLLLISTDYLTRAWLPIPGAIPPMGF